MMNADANAHDPSQEWKKRKGFVPTIVGTGLFGFALFLSTTTTTHNTTNNNTDEGPMNTIIRDFVEVDADTGSIIFTPPAANLLRSSTGACKSFCESDRSVHGDTILCDPGSFMNGQCSSCEFCNPSGGGGGDWEGPVSGASLNTPSYSAAAACNTCTTDDGVTSLPLKKLDACCANGLCGVCTNDAWNPAGSPHVTGFSKGLNEICRLGPAVESVVSVGHGMYEGHGCGECVCIRCDPTNSQGGCITDKPFLHMRQDNPNGPSNEVTSSFYHARWKAGGAQLQSWYMFKKVTSCDPNLCK